MPKRKSVPFNPQLAGSSDDYDSSYSGPRAKEKIKRILTSAASSFYSKSKVAASVKKRKVTEDEGRNSGTSTESELEYKSNLKTTKFENESSKKNKIKKRKRENVSDDSDSEAENNVSASLIEKASKKLPDKPRKKLKKKEEEKIFNSQDLLKYLNKSNDMTNKNDSSSNEENTTNKFTTEKYVSLRDIKKELLSNDSETDSEATSRNNALVNNITGNYAIKNEQQSQCSSDSEVEDDAGTEFSTKSMDKSVTILQHIKLTPKSKTSAERLREHFHDLQPRNITADFELSDSEEVSILRIPRNVNLQLKNVEIDPENKCKIKLEEKYVMTPTTNIPDPNYIVCTNSRVVQFKNNIKMEKYIKSRSEPNVMVQEKTLMPLPENLKKRHPLFGSDFHRKIRLSERVEKKIDDAIANLLKMEKKAKKKKTKKRKPEPRAVENQEIFNLLNSHSFLTNNDRVKKETSDDSAFGSSSSTDNIGKKKQRGQTSEKHFKQELEVTNLNESVFKSPKKKKLKTSHDWSNSGIKEEIREADTVDYEESPSSLKRKNKGSVINSTLMSDVVGTPRFNQELSTIISDASVSGKKPKKSKKDKKVSDIQKETLISELLNDVTLKIKFSKSIKEET